MLVLTGCKKDAPESKYPHYGFPTKELIVDVTPDTKSFRIDLNAINYIDLADVYFKDKESTGKDGLHFSNELNKGGEFQFTSFKHAYLDFPIYPENITEEVKLVFIKLTYGDEPLSLIHEMTVVLRPKTTNQ